MSIPIVCTVRVLLVIPCSATNPAAVEEQMVRVAWTADARDPSKGCFVDITLGRHLIVSANAARPVQTQLQTRTHHDLVVIAACPTPFRM